MALCLITYELRLPSQSYQPLWNVLGGIGAQRVLESVWILRTNSTPSALRDHLRVHLDSDDRILVTEMGIWGTWNTMSNINQI